MNEKQVLKKFRPINNLVNQDDFIKKLKQYNKIKKGILGDQLKYFTFEPKGDFLLIDHLGIDGLTLEALRFSNIDFNSCNFNNIEATDCVFHSCTFKNCRFNSSDLSKVNFFECDLEDCELSDCNCHEIKFSDCILKNLFFLDCVELYDAYFGNNIIDNVIFRRCDIYFSRFDTFTPSGKESLLFKMSNLNNCSFYNADLSFSNFFGCKFEYSNFSNCKLHKQSFTGQCHSINEAYCSIDLQSLIISDNLPKKVLTDIYGIHNEDIKQYISDLTTPIIYHKVFISYSFKDRKFAQMINESLRQKGVLTFLWENDAPGGRPLKTIMSENIQQFDKLLFIASEHSIKSNACQYELTEGRKKQDTLWKTVFFPIHIDDFLFTVKKDDIRPRDKQKEYWANIKELKDINSCDFSRFNKETINMKEFEEATHKLSKDLKNKSE